MTEQVKYSSYFSKISRTLLSAAFLGVLASPLTPTLLHAGIDREGKVPPVEFVQARMWKNMQLADFRLEGEVRTNKKKYPIVLRTHGYEMVYEFVDQPLQIRVVIDPDSSSIQKRSKATDSWTTLNETDKLKTVLDTDITYEDLCLDFIRWEKVSPLGTDNIKTLPTWAFEAEPTGKSRYTKARYWISSEYFAFMRVDAYNSQNQVIKRVEVNSVKKIGKAYTIEEMMISNLIPGRDISKTQTWVTIFTGKEGSSGL
jgi:hypothetical protein